MNTPGLAWFKSSYSGTDGDDCVEVALAEQAVCVRDSKDTDRPHLAITPRGWAQFITHTAHR